MVREKGNEGKDMKSKEEMRGGESGNGGGVEIYNGEKSENEKDGKEGSL